MPYELRLLGEISTLTLPVGPVFPCWTFSMILDPLLLRDYIAFDLSNTLWYAEDMKVDIDIFFFAWRFAHYTVLLPNVTTQCGWISISYVVIGFHYSLLWEVLFDFPSPSLFLRIACFQIPCSSTFSFAATGWHFEWRRSEWECLVILTAHSQQWWQRRVLTPPDTCLSIRLAEIPGSAMQYPFNAQELTEALEICCVSKVNLYINTGLQNGLTISSWFYTHLCK